MTLEQQLHKAAIATKLSILQLSKRADVPYSAMHRFMVDGGGITLATASKIANLLGLELRPVRRKRKG